MEIVADVVKLIFKTGLNYRGSNEDSPYTDNDEIDKSTLPNCLGSIIYAQPPTLSS